VTIGLAEFLFCRTKRVDAVLSSQQLHHNGDSGINYAHDCFLYWIFFGFDFSLFAFLYFEEGILEFSQVFLGSTIPDARLFKASISAFSRFFQYGIDCLTFGMFFICYIIP
jgi:hypothetical protein